MTYIAIVQDMKVRRIPVTMGVDGDVVVEVIPTDGSVLQEGMQVIANGRALVSWTGLPVLIKRFGGLSEGGGAV